MSERHTNTENLPLVPRGRDALPDQLLVDVQRLVTASLADASKRAYRLDIAHFEETGRRLPATPEMVATYLAEGAQTYAVATLQRRLVSISKAHRAISADDPTKSQLVRATLRGVRRTIGVKQRQAQPLLRDDLFVILDRLGDRLKDVRDYALLLLGFATAMRRSELVALNVEDIELTTGGMLLTVRRSKTDQEGAGRKIAVPFGRTRHCPIAAFKRWLEVAGIQTGAIFPGIDKHGHILSDRISGEAVSIIMKERTAAAGFNPHAYSGHSLRAGFITSAAMAGASVWKIRQQSGHASENMVSRYVRDADLFNENAATRIL